MTDGVRGQGLGGPSSPGSAPKTVQFDEASNQSTSAPLLDDDDGHHHHHHQKKDHHAIPRKDGSSRSDARRRPRTDPSSPSQQRHHDDDDRPPSKQFRKARAADVMSDSDETIELPERFDAHGRPLNGNGQNGRGIGERIESVLNGRAAGNLLRRVFD